MSIATLIVITIINSNLMGIDGTQIVWNSDVERHLPTGYTSVDDHRWRDYMKSAKILHIDGGCGRMQNRLITFNDGQRACVRYRQNIDQLQGELFSFYLGRLLKLSNLPPSYVDYVNRNLTKWSRVLNELDVADWSNNRPIIITAFVDDLIGATIPPSIRDGRMRWNISFTNRPSTIDMDVELAQWSDLILFDYLTANLDRVVNNLYNKQWNADIMDAPAHNLAKRQIDNLLIFLDNESGLLHGYRLLKKYEVYHSFLLENCCLFRQQTIQIIRNLHKNQNVGDLLRDMYEKQNGVFIKDLLPTIPDRSIKILNERLDRIVRHLAECENFIS